MKKIPFWRLAAEILALYDLDQTMRKRALRDAGAWDASVDFQSSQYIEHVLVLVGWPTRSMVGIRAAHALALLVRHADHDVQLQERCLEYMMAIDQLSRGEVDRGDIAHLVDRICVNRGWSQVYGTQHDEQNGRYVPRPIIDERNVNGRRKLMGLPTLRQGIANMYRKYGSP